MLKSFPKILIIFFLTAFIIQLGCSILLLALPQEAVQAADNTILTPPGSFTPQVGIGTDFQAGKSYTPDGSTSMLAKYIRTVYNYGIGIIGILAAVVLMIGGVLWIVAGGNTTQIGEAKAWIGASLTGLVLALTSYLILNTVNPALVNLQISGITSVEKFIGGSCTTLDAFSATPTEPTCKNNYTKENCEKEGGSFVQDGICPTSCCAWDDIAIIGTAYKNCDDTTKLSLADCQKKAIGFLPSYADNAKCEKVSSLTGLESGYLCGKSKTEKVTGIGSCKAIKVQGGPTLCADSFTKEECNALTQKEFGYFNSLWLEGKTCPTPCCLYNYTSNFGGIYWADCLAKKNLSEATCKSMSSRTEYIQNGECKKNGIGSKCILKSE